MNERIIKDLIQKYHLNKSRYSIKDNVVTKLTHSEALDYFFIMITKRYGLDGWQPHTFKEVGNSLEISASRVMQVMAKFEEIFEIAKENGEITNEWIDDNSMV